MKTFAGSSFMHVFNAWYYSFSPTVAQYISTHQAARDTMKVVLYPLIGILHLSSMMYSALAFQPELGALIAGIVASSLIGLVYLAAPLSGVLWLARSRVYRSQRRATEVLAGLVLSLTLVFAIGERFVLSSIMETVSASIVLTMLSLGTILPAIKLSQCSKRKM